MHKTRLSIDQLIKMFLPEAHGNLTLCFPGAILECLLIQFSWQLYRTLTTANNKNQLYLLV